MTKTVFFAIFVITCTIGAKAAVLRERTLPVAECPKAVLATGARVTLPTFDGEAVAIRLGKRSVSGTGRVSFAASIEGWESLKSAVVVGMPDGFVATVQDLKTGHVFTFIRNADGLRVRESVPERHNARPHQTKSLPAPVNEKSALLKKVVGSGSTFASLKAKWLARGETETNVVDILVAYDASAADWVRENYGESGPEVFAETSVAKMNLALVNSGIDDAFRFRLAGVHIVAVDARTVRVLSNGESIVDYNRLLDLATEGTGVAWKTLRAAREDSSADIVTILVDNGDVEFGMVGLGYPLDADTLAADYFADYAYNICSVRDVANDHTMTHEVGHNMGAGHGDREQMNQYFWEVGPQLFTYSSAHYFSVPNDWNGETRYYTIMGYNWDGFADSDICIEAPYFSTPEKTFSLVEFDGEESVTNDTGVVVGTDRHDNARTLRETFAIAANYRFHKIHVAVDVGTGGGSVTGGGAFAAGQSVKLTAKALSGYVFAGWYGDYDEETGVFSNPLEGVVDYRTTTFSMTVPSEDTIIYARFIPTEDDKTALLSIDCLPDPEGYAAGTAINPIRIAVDSPSLPTVTVKNLPAGLKFNAKTGEITGTPTKPGLYTTSITAKNASKATFESSVEIKVANFTDALISAVEGVPNGLLDAYGPFIPGVPVDFTLACAANWKVSDLPAGLKFDAATGRITGTPTKPGASTVYFKTSVKDVLTGKTVAHVATATFIVDALRTLTLKVDGSGTGKVSGGGAFVANKKVTVKATADAKDNAKTGAVKSAFIGWFDGEVLLTKSASYSYVMTEEPEQGLTARFATAAEDAASISLAVNKVALSPTEPIVWTNMCGLAVAWPVAAAALSETTVKVAGLPAGLKLVQDKKTKEYVVSGAPSAASKLAVDKVQRVPSQVKFTVSTTGKSSQTFEMRMVVLPLPAWAQGTFSGFSADIIEEGSRTNGIGVASLTVSAAGKITGKFSLYGTNWTYSATGYTSFLDDPIETNQTFTLTVDAKSGKMVKELSIDVTPGWMTDKTDYLGCSLVVGKGEGVDMALRRDAWKDKILNGMFPSTAVSVEGYLDLKVKTTTAGKATFSGKIDQNLSVSSSCCAFYSCEGVYWTWLIVPYAKGVEGFVSEVTLPLAE